MTDEKIVYFTSGRILKNYPFKAFKISNRTVYQLPHAHAYLQIWYIKSGSCIHFLNNKEYELKKGDIFILPPDVVHYIRSAESKNLEMLGCEFMEEFICGGDSGKNGIYYDYINPFMVDLCDVIPFHSLNEIVANEVEKIFEELVREYSSKKPYFELGMRANFLKLLSIIVREYSTGDNTNANGYDKHKNAIAKVINFLGEHYSEKIYLEDACRLVFMSPTYFSCVFKQITGKTFTAYLNYIRIQKAKDLLFDHSKTLNKIATEVGFSDSAYFDRVFKKEMGVSPGKYRKFL